MLDALFAAAVLTVLVVLIFLAARGAFRAWRGDYDDEEL